MSKVAPPSDRPLELIKTSQNEQDNRPILLLASADKGLISSKNKDLIGSKVKDLIGSRDKNLRLEFPTIYLSD